MNDEKIEQILDGPAFNSHSKLDLAKRGAIFDAKVRREEQSQMVKLHGAEIEMVVQWAKAVVDSQHFNLEVDCQLSDQQT